MIRRSKEECQALMQAQKSSGINQMQFCKEHGLNPEYFSLRKMQLLSALELYANSTEFIRLDRAPGNEALSGAPVIIRLQGVELELASTTSSASFLAEVIHRQGGV